MKSMLILVLSGAMVVILTGVAFGAEYTAITDKLNSLNHSSAYSWEFNLEEDGYNQTNEVISKFELTFKNIRNYNNDKNELFVSILDPRGIYVKNGISGPGDWDNSYYLRHNTVDDYYDDDNDDWINYFVATAAKPNSNVGGAKQLLSISNLDTIGNDIIITFDLSDPSTNSVNIDGVDNETEKNNYDTLSSISDTAVADLRAFIIDGMFEIGIDPDCHFDADSAIAKIWTNSSGGGGGSPVPEPETLVLFGLGLLGVSAFGRKRFGSMG